MAPATSKPRIYIFYGTHHIRRKKLVQRLLEKAQQQGGQEYLDVVFFDAETLTVQKLYQEVLTLPFLASRRLVVVRDPLALVTKTEGSKASATARSRGHLSQQSFLRLLESVPEHTALVLDIPQDLPADHWLLVWARNRRDRAYLRGVSVPRTMGEMMRWMAQVMEEEGGRATNEALALLYNLVGHDVQRAYQELQKLALYSQVQNRPVTGEDVAALVLEGPPPRVFALGHALAGGQPSRAMRILHELLQQEDPRSLWNLVVNHFRLLLQVKELQEEKANLEAWARNERVPRFLLDRLARQARLFTLEQLESLYHRLVELEDRFRRFEITPAEALETVVYYFARAHARQ